MKGRDEMTHTTSNRYIVKVSQAQMPGSCWGSSKYRRIAIIETDGRPDVAMISERARGVRSIVEVAERVHMGRTMRSEGQQILREMQEHCAKLNAGLTA